MGVTKDKGITFQASYLIDPMGILRQITTSDLPVGWSAMSVDEALLLAQAFEFTVNNLSYFRWWVALTQSG